MEVKGIYTIGYGNRTIEDFINLLGAYSCEYLIDIRTKPYSRYNPSFNQDSLQELLKEKHVRYVYMGDLLGGMPNDPSCYTEGKADYTKIATTDFFKKGLARIQKAYEKECIVALMCSEVKPEECHRSKLVGKELYNLGIAVFHINQDGELINQNEVMDLLLQRHTLNLFNDKDITSVSRNKHYNNENPGSFFYGH